MKHDTVEMLAHKIEQYAEENNHILNTRNVIEILKELDYTVLDNKKFVYIEKNGASLSPDEMLERAFGKEMAT